MKIISLEQHQRNSGAMFDRAGALHRLPKLTPHFLITWLLLTTLVLGSQPVFSSCNSPKISGFWPSQGSGYMTIDNIELGY